MGLRRSFGRVIFTKVAVLTAMLIAGQGKAIALNIGPLLDSCPQSDPAYEQIRRDFEIRRNGVPVGDVFCAEPASQLPLSQYTDELIVLQSLRSVYSMDLGANHLPWAPGTLYEWMKSKMTGIDISDTAAFSSCCETIDGKRFFIRKAQDDFNRDFDRQWIGISGDIGLYAHELRHLDGFPHTSCCGIPGGCDQTYDETNLTPYGIQWWLESHWLTGELYVGFSCLEPSQVAEAENWHLASCDGQFRERFCDNKPPLLSLPAMPGGECRVEDHPPDCSAATAQPAVLWPPNHGLRSVSVQGATDPDGDPVSILITGIRQDEPRLGSGTGNTCPDAGGIGTATAQLRAERSGFSTADGRVYHVSFTADDGRGSRCAGTVPVCVPYDSPPGPAQPACIDSGPLVNSSDCNPCGDYVIKAPEVCDGANLGGETCQTQGFDAGALSCNATCNGFDTAGCSIICGNGIRSGNELCDWPDLAGETCTNFGFDGGELSCNATCDGFDTQGCSVICGNGIRSGNELCDGPDLTGRTCMDLGFDGGALSCNATCNGFDTAGCSVICGNGIRSGDELCDGSDLGEQTCKTRGFGSGTLTCNGTCDGIITTGCSPCGNDHIDPGEMCDGTDLAGQTCVSLGFEPGVLSCNSACSAFVTLFCGI